MGRHASNVENHCTREYLMKINIASNQFHSFSCVCKCTYVFQAFAKFLKITFLYLNNHHFLILLLIFCKMIWHSWRSIKYWSLFVICNNLYQACTAYGPRAKCGPPRLQIWLANTWSRGEINFLMLISAKFRRKKYYILVLRSAKKNFLARIRF